MHTDAIVTYEWQFVKLSGRFVETQVTWAVEVCLETRKHTDISGTECSTAKYVKHRQDSSIELERKWIRKGSSTRDKNNEASKVTRAKRKQKQEDLYQQEAEHLKVMLNWKINMEVMLRQKFCAKSLSLNWAVSNLNYFFNSLNISMYGISI